MNREQAINYLRGSGMTEEQIKEIAEALGTRFGKWGERLRKLSMHSLQAGSPVCYGFLPGLRSEDGKGGAVKIETEWKRLDADTVNGEMLKITTTYKSFNKGEIDYVQEWCKKAYGSGIIIDTGDDDGVS